MIEETVKKAPEWSDMAERVLSAIEKAGGAAGSEARRLWPEMVASYQAQAVAELAIGLVVMVATGIFGWRMMRFGLGTIGDVKKSLGGSSYYTEREMSLPGGIAFVAGAASAVFCSLLLIFGVGLAPNRVARIVAPEGTLVLEIVRGAK